MKNLKFFAFPVIFLAVSFSVSGQAEAPKGAVLYQLKCGRCHVAYAPEKYSPEEWKTVLKEMGTLAGLTEETEEEILDFLSQASLRKERGAFPTSPVLAGYLYTEYFSSKDSTDTFDVHYLNFNISGRVHERISYRAEFELEHGGGKEEPPFVEQAYLDVWLMKSMAFRIGAMLTPFNRFDDLHGPIENFLVTRPLASQEIGVSAWKEVGVNLHGNFFLHKHVYLNYDLYAINGLGGGSRLRKSRQYVDNNDAKTWGFRLSGVFLDQWEAGASFSHGAWDDEGDLNLNMLGFHFLGKMGGINLFAEYSRALSENPQPVDRGKADGFFVQASYLISGKFRPTVRFGTLDYLDRGFQRGRKPTDYDAQILALGFNFYPTPAVVFKIEYDFIMEKERVPERDNNLLALQAAVRF